MLVASILDTVFSIVTDQKDYRRYALSIEGAELTAIGSIKSINLESSTYLDPRVSIQLTPAWHRGQGKQRLQCNVLTIFVNKEKINTWAALRVGDEATVTFRLQSLGPTPCLWIDRFNNVFLRCVQGEIVAGERTLTKPQYFPTSPEASMVLKRQSAGAAFYCEPLQTPLEVERLPWKVRKLSTFREVQYSFRDGESISPSHILSFWSEVEEQTLSIGDSVKSIGISANLLIESGELTCTIDGGSPLSCICVCLLADEHRWVRYVRTSVNSKIRLPLVDQVWNLLLPRDHFPFTRAFTSFLSQRNCSSLDCLLGSDLSEKLVYHWSQT